MNIFLLIFIIFILIIFLLLPTIEHFYYPNFYGRDPNSKEIPCCGNMDWYLGKEYKNTCKNNIPTAFVNTEFIEGFQLNTEMTAKDAYVGNLEYHKQLLQCQEEDESWIASYNPAVCVQNGKVVAEANCKCINPKDFKCTKCFPKIDLSKYLE